MTESSISESDRKDDLESAAEEVEAAAEKVTDEVKDTVEAAAEEAQDQIEDATDAAKEAETVAETTVDEIREVDDHAHHADHSDDGSGQGSSFAATALKLLMIVIVVFGLAVWLLPTIAPHLPASVAKYVMPGQQMLDQRLAAMEERLDERAGSTGADVEKMQAEIASLTERLAAAEAAAAAARTEAESAKTAAASSAEAASATSALPPACAGTEARGTRAAMAIATVRRSVEGTMTSRRYRSTDCVSTTSTDEYPCAAVRRAAADRDGHQAPAEPPPCAGACRIAQSVHRLRRPGF